MSKTRRNFTHFLLLAVSGVGLLSALLLLTDPPPQEIRGMPEIFSSNSVMPESKRSVASLDPAQSRGLPEAAILEINCAQNSQHLEASGPRFRLKGPLCVRQDVSVVSTKVTNKTNGYVATVFHQATQFSTDYINLNEGRNEIKIQFETDHGKIEKNIVIVRNENKP